MKKAQEQKTGILSTVPVGVGNLHRRVAEKKMNSMAILSAVVL